MAKIIVVDANIVIWGILEEGKQEDQHKIPLAKALFRQAARDNNLVALPVVTLPELTIKLPDERRDAFLTYLQENFMLLPYDYSAAISHNAIFQKYVSSGHLQKIRAIQECSRDHFKIDQMVVAIAHARKAMIIYSDDKHIPALADGFVSTRALSEMPIQLGFSGL